ncbi:MAG: OprO/OprP family phosphate-selective porin [Holophagales bacterium]|jgi:hypothetical protein|nr:OprO/OprP family phosphate-selective porin [Holophagales bacterium]
MKISAKISAKTAALAILATSSLFLSAQAPATIEGKESTLKIGFMAQPSFEAVESSNSKLEGTSQNLFLRRMRLMLSGNIGTDFEYFIITDDATLGKGVADGTKTNGGFVIQDAVLTYKFTEKIKLDAGLIIVPLSHISTQAATNLHSWDFGTYAFSQSSPMGSSTNRDGGMQVRGVVGKTHGNLEFRLGVFQGKRAAQVSATEETLGKVNARNSFRLAGRAQWNFFDAEGGLFLGGSYLGAKKVLSIGVGHDRQEDYSATAVDVYMDMPIGSNGIMGQFDYVIMDGGKWLPTLRKQTTNFAELGYRIGALKLSPMVRYESRKMDIPLADASSCDETRVGAGLAWWFKGHQNNLKVFYTKVDPQNVGESKTLKAYNQINVQWQMLFW